MFFYNIVGLSFTYDGELNKICFVQKLRINEYYN